MMTMPTESKMAFTVAEACAATGIGKTSLYSLFKEKKLTPVKVCGRTLVLADDLRALLAAHKAA